MRPALELRWEFSPKDLFEENFAIELEACAITVEAGEVIAILPLDSVHANLELRAKVERHIGAMFLGVQVACHTPFDLSRPRVSTLREDGTRAYTIECEPGRFEFRGLRADLRYTAADGTVVDTRRQRIERKQRLSHLSATFAPIDDTLARMLRSYDAAVRDPSDELIHLYEILDSLASKFGSQHEALRRLAQVKQRWSRLGQLCNELPLRQGRHRGRGGAAIRDATEQELTEARDLAVSFLESYIRHLSGDTK